MRTRPLLVLIVLSALGAASAGAQSPGASAPRDSTPPANPADVRSMDAILKALYDVISGPAGRVRDWDRMRSLFAPGARLMPTRPKTDTLPGAVRVWSVEDYIGRAGPGLERNGFYEREIARTVEQYGTIAHVFSTYESRRTPTEAPFVRGINSIQLLDDGRRWWVVSVYWTDERGSGPIPTKYLK